MREPIGMSWPDSVEAIVINRVSLSRLSRKHCSLRGFRILNLNSRRRRRGFAVHPLRLLARVAIRKVMECPEQRLYSLTFAALMIGVQRAISLFTNAASG